MHFVRRLLVLGLAALVVAALTAGIANAALWLNFSKASAEPGEVVFVRTAGTGALAGARSATGPNLPRAVCRGGADPFHP